MKTNLFVLFVSLIIFMVSVTSPINLFGQQSWLDIKNNYSPDTKYFGHWEMDNLKSFTRDKGGVYIKKLSLKNDTSHFEKIERIIAKYNKIDKVNFGLDLDIGFQMISIGSVKMEFHAVKADTAFIENCFYTITNSHGIYRLIIFLDRGLLMKEIGDLIVLEILENDANKDILRLASSTFESEYILHKKESINKTNFNPQNKNDSQYLNSLGLKERVKAYTRQRYSSRRLNNGTYLLNKFKWVSIKQFKKNGDLEKYKIMTRSWGYKIKIIEYFIKGNYENVVYKGDFESEIYADSINISTQKSKRIEKGYNNGILTSKSESELVNDQVIKSIYKQNKENSLNWYTDYNYDKNGEVFSKISYNDKDKSRNSEYYHILNYDKQGNWTKRIIFSDKFLSKDKYIEERKLEYYK